MTGAGIGFSFGGLIGAGIGAVAGFVLSPAVDSKNTPSSENAETASPDPIATGGSLVSIADETARNTEEITEISALEAYRQAIGRGGAVDSGVVSSPSQLAVAEPENTKARRSIPVAAPTNFQIGGL